jgi:Bacterial dnaA protein helix-turn-helix
MADDYEEHSTEAPTIKAIEQAVAYFFGIGAEELHHKSTTRAVRVPRQIAMYLMKQMTEASVRDIGQHFGNRRSRDVARAIAKLEEQRRKEDFVDLVICQLTEHTEVKLGLERDKIGALVGGRCSLMGNRLMRKIEAGIEKTRADTQALKKDRHTRVDQSGAPLPSLFQG